ncbi:MAG: lysylphosphatidylglycerol synthase domain-containing protein [Phycisphaerales bacterium]|nr:lysylphosphatidylglycerol synthase domain-containing protein [Phycisphaerales bacterium]
MTDTDDRSIADVRRKMLSPKRIAIQILGFLIGLAFVIYLVKLAFYGEADWSRIREASPWLIAGLLLTGLLGTVLDGLVFWGIMRPYHKLGVMEVQGANMTASFLNYAPVRLGTVFRIIFHATVDRIALIPIFGWFAAITVTTLACMASVVCATLITGGPGVWWLFLLGCMLLVSGILIWFIARLPVVEKHGRGIDRMFGDPRALIAGLAGRLMVLASGCLRMAIAAEILGIPLGVSEVILLSVAALMLSFNPLGRFGWREATVTMVTAQFAASSLGGENVQEIAAQLALIESAGEALVVVPLGIVTSIWATRRIARSRSKVNSTSSPEESGEDRRQVSDSEA